MNKALPYVLAVVVGLAVVGGFYWFGADASASAGGTGPGTHARASRAAPGEADDPAAQEAEKPKRKPGDPPPPPGTLRPMNKAEIAYQTRAARPVNAHYDYTASWRRRAVQILSKSDPALAKEVADLDTKLKEGTAADTFDGKDLMRDQLSLLLRIRDSGKADAELSGILDYLELSAKEVLQDGDPASVPKPPKIQQ